MIRRKQILTILTLLALCLALSGCAGQINKPDENLVTFSAGTLNRDATNIQIALTAGETALLEEMSSLRAADFRGSEDPDEILAWADAHPEVRVTCDLVLPDGTVTDTLCRSLDLSDKSDAQIEAYLPLMARMRELETVRLGSERPDLSWETVQQVHTTCPAAALKYRFTLYGKNVDLSNTTLNLSHIPIDDEAKLVEQVIDMMPNLVYLDMDTCGVSNERMAQLRDAHPDVRVVWRVWFGDAYSVRTDVEMILASKPSVGGMLYDYNVDGLYYCTEVRFLDIGHNAQLTDIGFVRNMPKLSTAIIAMCGITDLSPLADCPELEYLEMFSMPCSDVSPLANLKELRHINLVNCLNLLDISPLYNLTELDRLWVGSMTRITNEQVAEMQKHAPGCEINTLSYTDPTGDGWRFKNGDQVPRYWLLREQFNGYTDKAYSFWWNDPLY